LIPIIRYLKETGWDKVTAYETVIRAILLDYLNENPDWYTICGEKSADPTLRMSLIRFTVNGVLSSEIAQEIHDTTGLRITNGDCYSVHPVYDIVGIGMMVCSVSVWCITTRLRKCKHSRKPLVDFYVRSFCLGARPSFLKRLRLVFLK